MLKATNNDKCLSSLSSSWESNLRHVEKYKKYTQQKNEESSSVSLKSIYALLSNKSSSEEKVDQNLSSLISCEERKLQDANARISSSSSDLIDSVFSTDNEPMKVVCSKKRNSEEESNVNKSDIAQDSNILTISYSKNEPTKVNIAESASKFTYQMPNISKPREKYHFNVSATSQNRKTFDNFSYQEPTKVANPKNAAEVNMPLESSPIDDIHTMQSVTAQNSNKFTQSSFSKIELTTKVSNSEAGAKFNYHIPKSSKPAVEESNKNETNLLKSFHSRRPIVEESITPSTSKKRILEVAPLPTPKLDFRTGSEELAIQYKKKYGGRSGCQQPEPHFAYGLTKKFLGGRRTVKSKFVPPVPQNQATTSPPR